jgi:hypothetical protein
MPADETLDELIERLALNSEMGAVSQLMQERQAMQNESDPDRLAEVSHQIRALKLAEPEPARGKASLEEPKHLANGQKNGYARSKEHSLER